MNTIADSEKPASGRLMAALGSPHGVALGLFASALLLRLAFIWSTRGDHRFATPLPSLDIAQYWEAARQLRAGVPFSFELAACSAPLFAYVVAALQAITDESLLGVRMLLAVVACAKYPVLWYAARRLSIPLRAAAFAIALLLFLPSLVYFDTMVLKSSVELTLLALLVLSVVSPLRHAMGRGFLIACILAACFLSQLGSFLFIVPALAFVALEKRRPRRERLVTAVTTAVLFSTVFCAFQWRDTSDRTAHYLPRAGVDMFIGLGPQATGYYMRLKPLSGTPYGHTFDARIRAELAEGRRLTPKEADKHYRNKLWEHVADQPGAVIRLLLFKTGLFLHNVEVKGIHYLGDLQKDYRLLRWSPVGFGWLVILAALGAISLARKKRYPEVALLLGLPAAILLFNLLAIVTWRFRVPATIPLCLLAAIGTAYLFELKATMLSNDASRWRVLALPIALALFAGYAAHRPILRSAQTPAFRGSFQGRADRANAERKKIIAEQERLQGKLDPLQRVKATCALLRHTECARQVAVLVDSPAQRQRRASRNEVDTEDAMFVDTTHLWHLHWARRYEESAAHLELLAETAPSYYRSWQRNGTESDAEYRARIVLETRR